MSQPPSSGVSVLADARNRRAKSDYPLKRKPREHSKEAKRKAAGDLARFLANWDPLHEVAAELPQWQPGDRGRPPDMPPAAHLIFGILHTQLGNDRDAEAELGYQPTWQAVRRALSARYPEYRGLRPDALPISRREFWRFREKHGISDDILDQLRVAFREQAAQQAVAAGMFDAHQGSVTHPALQNTLVGDGTVIRPHYKGTPSRRQVDRATGEVETVKFDPDANFFKTGDGEDAYGIKFGLIEAWQPASPTRVENERIILDVFNIRHETGYDEAAQATKSIESLVGLLPGAQAVEWDMALHGTHFDKTRELGLVDIVKVNKTAAKAGKKIPPPRNEHGKSSSGHLFTLPDDTTEELALYTYFGHPHIEVIAEGKKQRIPIIKTRLRRVANRSGGYRIYGDYKIPDDPRVPRPRRGATVTVRLSRSKHDGIYNRAEHLRPITIFDPILGNDPDHTSEFDQLYVLRPGAESINRSLKQHFTDKRAPAVGRHRIMFMLICAGLLNNAKAALAHQQRLQQAA